MTFSRRKGERCNRGRIDDGVGVFSPRESIGGLVLWLDNTLITESGGLVTAWPDLSGANNHASQPNPLFQPAYEATGWNGTQPSVAFNAVLLQVLEANGCAPGFSGDDAPYTLTWVAQRTAAESVGERHIIGLGRASTGLPAVRAGAVSAFWGFLGRDDAGTESQVYSAVNAIVATRHQFTAHFDGTTRSLYLDGALIDSDATALGATTLDQFYFGHWRTVAGYDFRTPGCTLYNTALSAPDRALLWQYNRDHFGGLP